MLHVYAALAEKERTLISERTRVALRQAKQRGQQLGNRTNLAEAGKLGAEAGKRAADQFAANVLPLVRQIQAVGAVTLAQIAEALNARGVQTARGGAWYPSTVKNLLDRA
jgi:DNA invertase Pin-like site-specific DNA recombinase